MEHETINSTTINLKRFWEQVDQSGGPDACWPWMGSINKRGLGEHYVGESRSLPVHRVVWLIEHGTYPDRGMPFKWSCGNKLCCNPNHISYVRNGTQLDYYSDGHAEFTLKDPYGEYRIIIDGEDADKVSVISWHVLRRQKQKGIIYIAHMHKGTPNVTTHLSVFLMGKPPEGCKVIHKDGNPLNYQKSNLEFVRHSEVMWKRARWKVGSPYRGVRPHSQSAGLWVAQITHEGAKYYLGCGGYEDLEYLARLYDEAAKRFRGDRAILNFPDEI